MKITIRASLPRWACRIIDEARDFRDHRNSWFADTHLENGAPPNLAHRTALTADLLLLRYWMPVMCELVGHERTDYDLGDPEVGPSPDVYCTRCHRR